MDSIWPGLMVLGLLKRSFSNANVIIGSTFLIMFTVLTVVPSKAKIEVPNIPEIKKETGSHLRKSQRLGHCKSRNRATMTTTLAMNIWRITSKQVAWKLLAASLFNRFVHTLAEIHDEMELVTSAAEKWLRTTDKVKALSRTPI
mmetsp:Transcript_4376/g.10149  ORF Transcript_4376/g.10149 Transcript_4376/m.10149 type:complete len:144 (+) Transcript_4376:571-1002(+)